MTELAALKARILANPEARADYEAQAPEFELARELIAARTRVGLGATFPMVRTMERKYAPIKE
ncbi:hypothetical protein [Thauera sp.]|uniref:hypothetical protein n=1 Tax=Thauera sp. TaxID=1905334 RepID=UPI002C9B193F|nr:hypothetical protein [Thauera sp.]HRP24239.1 hypothetical protein [Thauera sp.]